MKFYFVTVDTNYIAPMPMGWYGKIDRKSWREKKSYQMPKYLMFQTEEHIQMVFTDIVVFPCFMVSKLVRDVIGLYNPAMKFVRIILYDKLRKRSMAYYMPFMRTIEFMKISDESKYGEDNIFLEYEKVTDEVMFEVVNKGKTHIVMRMDLLESILRRGAIGLGIKEEQII